MENQKINPTQTQAALLNWEESKANVLKYEPGAFLYTYSNGWTKRPEYVIQRLIKSGSDIDGDNREELGASADTPELAWNYAWGRIYQERLNASH